MALVDTATTFNDTGLPDSDQAVQLSMGTLTKLLQLCKNDSTEAVTKNPRNSGNDRDAFLYIIVVLLFYALAMVVLMVKYIKREEQEAELNYYFSEFVNRDKFETPRYQNRQKVKAVKKSLMYKPLLMYSQNMAQAFQRSTRQALQQQGGRAQDASADAADTGADAADAGADAADATACADVTDTAADAVDTVAISADACTGGGAENTDTNAVLGALFGADVADAGSVHSADSPRPGKAVASTDVSPAVSSSLQYIDSSDAPSSDDSCVVSMFKITAV